MKISLKRTLINAIDFAILDPSDTAHDQGGEFHINFDKVYPEDNNKSFIIKFNIVIKDNEEYFSLKMSVNAIFETDEEIDEEFKTSAFPNVNAPAIAYPFLRSHVSHLTLLSGINPVMLPTINFTNFLKARKEDTNNRIID